MAKDTTHKKHEDDKRTDAEKTADANAAENEKAREHIKNEPAPMASKGKAEDLRAARDRLKKERGMSEEAVLSMNDDAVLEGVAQIDRAARKTAEDQDKANERNKTDKRVGADVA